MDINNKVLNVHTATEEEKINAKYIGRGSVHGNPFKIGGYLGLTRDQVCDLYESYWNGLPIEEKEKRIDDLRGKNLLCFCAPKRCHGDFLLKVCNNV